MAPSPTACFGEARDGFDARGRAESEDHVGLGEGRLEGGVLRFVARCAEEEVEADEGSTRVPEARHRLRDLGAGGGLGRPSG